MTSTLKQSGASGSDDSDASPPVPGLLLVFSGRSPLWAVLPLQDREIRLGRDSLEAVVQDPRISRRHVRVFLKDERFYAVDLGSLNGTSVDGRPAAANEPQPIERCLRIGHTLFLVSGDVRAQMDSAIVTRAGRVIGPHMYRLYQAIARLSQSTPTLHITGESGVGKEDAARSFHASSSRKSGPFIAVNCAAIPEGIAERLLFGVKRGAFSGADADAQGYVQAADGGTLFLDELAELHGAVQAKLLRVLENREVQAVGAVRATPVDIRVCSASNAALRAQVAAGKLREDLYYRIGRPEIAIPPLRERLEELPWLVDGALKEMEGAPPAHYSFIDACLLRPWPGNIRELLTEVRAAAQEAIAALSPRIEAKHLAAAAGQVIRFQAATAPAPSPAPPPAIHSSPALRSEDEIKRSEIEETLRKTGGNVSKAARALEMHRNSLRRLMDRYGIDLSRLAGLNERY
jgi:DNA-binding NtrC family response regulator